MVHSNEQLRALKTFNITIHNTMTFEKSRPIIECRVSSTYFSFSLSIHTLKPKSRPCNYIPSYIPISQKKSFSHVHLARHIPDAAHHHL